ncbi:MAG: ATP-binding protein [Elainella sp.]
MTSSGDLSLPTESKNLTAANGEADSAGEFDLVFTQDRNGRYLSFYWKDAAQHNLRSEQIVGTLKPAFAPAAPFYLERVAQVLESAAPVQFQCPFGLDHNCFLFELTLSPVPVAQGSITLVVATGRLLERAGESLLTPPEAELTQLRSPRPASTEQVSEQAIQQVINAARQTLDLNQIAQRTAAGLAAAFRAEQGIFCTYLADGGLPILAMVSPEQPPEQLPEQLPEADQTENSLEYPDLSTWLGSAPSLTTEVNQALITLKPVLTVGADPRSLVLPTRYQGQVNGLVLLHQIRGPELPGAELTGAELTENTAELLEELAVQLGTGIAQAQMLAESQRLAVELQQINDRLMRQQSDLEEARQHAEAASRLKSEFLANTSHELRTPLNGILGFLKLILDGMVDDPEERTQFIDEAYRSARLLLDLINDILDIAKIEAGKMQLDLNPIQLDDLLLDVEKFTRPQAQQKHLSFEIRAPDTRDQVILYGNYQRLKQVMLNLVGNAIKFTHEGSITISAEVIPGKVVVQEEEKPGTVKISVADTGIGVSLEKQDKLFQSFSQVDGSRTRQYGGTGLGLAISQKLVEAMGGVVNFFSMGEGLGSTVTFTVPLYQDPVMVTAPLTDSADLLL